jgi:hypothetical protein
MEHTAEARSGYPLAYSIVEIWFNVTGSKISSSSSSCAFSVLVELVFELPRATEASSNLQCCMNRKCFEI